MAKAVKTVPGDTLASIAANHYGDAMRCFDLVEFNGLDPAVIFDEIPEGVQLDLPDPLELFEPARPVLQRASEIVTDVETAITQIAGVLPPGLAGYTDEALRFLGEINGAIGSVETTIMGVLEDIPGAARAVLGDSTYRVVEWMLHRSRDGFTIGEAVQFAADELGLSLPPVLGSGETTAPKSETIKSLF
jgi:phage tail protein X